MYPNHLSIREIREKLEILSNISNVFKVIGSIEQPFKLNPTFL